MMAGRLRQAAVKEFRARRVRRAGRAGESRVTARHLRAVPSAPPADAPVRDLWEAKQRLARPGRYYGDGGTLHSVGFLDVEVHKGQVVGVWFRCQLLPFVAREVGPERAESYAGETLPNLTGVELRDYDPPREN